MGVLCAVFGDAVEIQQSCQALPFAVGFVEVGSKALKDFLVVDIGIFKAGRVDESEVVAMGREIVRLDLGGCCRKNSVRVLASRRRLKLSAVFFTYWNKDPRRRQCRRAL